MLQNTDRGASEPPTGSFSNTDSPADFTDSFERGGAPSATDAPFGAGVSGGGGRSSSTRSTSSPSTGSDSPADSTKGRRRGTRGGRKRRSKAEGQGSDSSTAPSDASSSTADAPTEAPADSQAEAGTDDRKPAREKRTRRGKRGSRSSSKRDDAPELAPESESGSESESESGSIRKPAEAASDADPDDTKAGRAAPRKRTRRKRKSAAEKASSETGGEAPEQGAASSGETNEDDGERPRRRRRGSRGGRGRRRAGDVPLEVEVIPGEEDDLPDLPDLPAEAEILDSEAEPRGRRKRSRKKAGSREPAESTTRKKTTSRGRRATRDRDEDEAEPTRRRSPRKAVEVEPGPPTLILVNASDEEEQRVAVVQEGLITDFSMTSGGAKTYVNDIYRGRVVNLEPAIGAAFIDFGQGRNGFLHTSDVITAYGEKGWKLDKLLTTTVDPEEWDGESSQPSVGEELSGEDTPPSPKKKTGGPRTSRHRARPRLPVTDLLKKGQMVVVQVTKDAIGDKGPTLTTYISIPGRYLVLMPSMTRTGVSRKIEDDKERRRLKRILESLEVPPGMGVIVRTAGVGRTKVDLKRDLIYLKGAWDAFGKQLRAGSGPAPLYRESDVAIRTMRDLFTPNTEAVYVDDAEVHKHLVEFTERLMPENVERIQLHQGPRPLFHTHGVEQDFEKLFTRRIELPSGGSIVFDQTEALVAIDVNSGRTRTNGTYFEEIALKTNSEAAPEIARQIRLRDLGGIIVCDFIDMMRQTNMRQVERLFKAALVSDRARSKVGRISQFGLLELTRQRLGPGLTKRLFHTCSACRGTGRIRNVESRAAAILRRLGSALTLKGFSKVEVRAHPEVVDYLEDHCSEQIRAFEYLHQREISLTSVPDQPEDSVLRYLRADGREVRPGGRRKR